VYSTRTQLNLLQTQLEDALAHLTAENIVLREELADLRSRVRGSTSISVSPVEVLDAARHELQSALKRLQDATKMTLNEQVEDEGNSWQTYTNNEVR
jgi:hypothetical protein